MASKKLTKILAPPVEAHRPVENGGWHRWTEPVAVVTALLFIATVGLVWETRELVSDADDASRKQLRAYVVLEPQDFGVFGDRITITLKLKNSGSTPAHRVSSTSTAKVLPRPLPADYVFAPGPPEKTPFILYPGQERISTNVHDIKLSPEEMTRLGNGEALYFYGEITYVDAFEKTQRATYCIYVRGQIVVETYARRDGPERSMPEQWFYAEKFNEGT